MVFSYEEKVIIKYKCGATRIVNDHPEYKWNVNGVKKLFQKIDKTGDVAQIEISGRPKSAFTEENIRRTLEEMILGQ